MAEAYDRKPEIARRVRAEKKRERLAHILEDVEAAIATARALLEHEEPATALKAANCIGQLAVSYARVYEVGEIEGRIEDLESRNT